MNKNLIISEDKEISIIKSNIKYLKNKIISTNKEINENLQTLENQHFEYCVKLKQLENEITIMRFNKNITSGKINVNTTQEDIKDIFRKIARNTHPDKTNDENLHEIFVKAKEAYDNSDYNELLNLSNSNINTNINLDVLKKQLKNIEAEYIQLTKSNTYAINNLFISNKKSDNVRAIKLFLDLILSRIIELEEVKSALS